MPGTRKLGKPTEARFAMLRQQVTDFLDKGRMETTLTRAKEIRPIAEKMITLGKKNTLASRRDALSFITREDVTTKIFAEIAPKYAGRQGGYCRIVKIGPRRGDNAEMAVIMLVDEAVSTAPAKTLPLQAAAPAAAAPAKEAEVVAEVEETVDAPETVLELEAEVDPVDAVELEAVEAEAAEEAEAEASEESK